MATSRKCGECGATMPPKSDEFACFSCKSAVGRLAEIEVWIGTDSRERLKRNHEWGALYAQVCQRLLAGDMRATDADCFNTVMRWLDAWQIEHTSQIAYWPFESKRSWSLRRRVVEVIDLIKGQIAIVPRPIDIQPQIRQLIAVYLGNRKYRVGDDPPIVLQESEDHVLRSLIDLEAASKDELVRQTGKNDAPRVLGTIRKKHPSLAPFIILPGRRGMGGYGVTIKAAEA